VIEHTDRAAGRMGPAPGTTENPPLEPVLFPDIDPILLAKVHGNTEVQSLPDMEAAAMAQGQATAAEGAANEASQQEPVVGSPEYEAGATRTGQAPPPPPPPV
jgi:hypothetical protein